jgi:hypothetical protein
MSEESFFNTVRNKLESIRPPVEEGAWKKLQSSLPMPWYSSLFKEFGSWIIGGITTAALIGTGVINYQQKQENEKLYGEISTLKSEIQNIQTKTDTVYIEKTSVDTVYVTNTVKVPVYKYLQVPINNEYSEKTSIGNNSKEDVAKNEVEANEVTNVVHKNQSKKNTSNFKNKEGSNFDVKSNRVSVKKSSKSDQISEKLKSSTNNRNLVDSRDSDKNETPKNETVEKSGNSITSDTPGNETELIENTRNKVEVNDNLSRHGSGSNEKQSEVLDKTDVNNQENHKVIPELEKEKITEKPESEEMVIPNNPNKIIPEIKKKTFKIPYVHTRVGMTADLVGFKQIAVGPTGEFFIGNRFSFNLGLIFSGEKEERHPFPKDFNYKTGKKFEDEFKPYFLNSGNKPERISDIKISTSFIKMPLYFSYYIPVNRNINFLVSGGTKLDLKVYKSINFQSGILGDIERNQFEAAPKVRTFNSFNYGMGVQYKYKKMVFQLQPYFDFQFRKIDYLNFPRKFGVNTSIKYDFGR